MQAGDSRIDTNGAGQRVLAFWSWRRLVRVGLTIFVFAAVGLCAGFYFFVEGLSKGEPVLNVDADGIVVLTGRASRISDAIELLATKHGKRLLITGVYPTTTADAIARLVPEHRGWFTCCVDLDHSAVNTIGNAVQTRIWVKRYDMKSLIVVTSNYHMPRAMTELAHQLPDVTLIPYSIPPERVRIDAWWTSFATTKLLFAEYLKYLRALLRTQTSFVLGGPDGT